MTISSSAGAIASVIKTSHLCAGTWNLIFLLCCSWENSQSAPVTHSRQVVKGPTTLLKITETALKCTSHAFQFVHLYNCSLFLLPYPHTITPPKLVKEPEFSAYACRQLTGFKLQTSVLSPSSAAMIRHETNANWSLRHLKLTSLGDRLLHLLWNTS